MKFLVFVLFPLAAWSAAMPIGIPDPGFGLEEIPPSRPADWSVEVPGYYFIENTTGTDSGRTYGRPGAPRLTIPRPVPVGSRVEISGLYASQTGGTTFFEGYGTTENWIAASNGPVWIIGCATNQAVFSKASIVYGTNVYIRGLTWTNTVNTSLQVSSGSILRPASRISIADCEIIGNGINTHSGFVTAGIAAEDTDNVVYTRNHIHHLGPFNSTQDEDAQAFASGTYITNVWVFSNVWHTIIGGASFGSAVIGTPSDRVSRIFIGSNYVYNCKQNGMTIKYGANIVFSQNTISNIYDNGGGLSPGKCIAAQYGPKGVWMLYNKMINARYGIYLSSTDSGGPWEIYAIGNTIQGMHHTTGSYAGLNDSESGILLRGSTHRFVINNSISDCDSGINGPGGAGAFQYLENNIIYNITQTNGYHFDILNSPANTILNNSILYDPTQPFRIRWATTVYTNLAAFQSATSRGNNCINADPMFAAPAFFDLQILTNSPARDAALAPVSLTTNVYQIYFDTFGVNIEVDNNRTNRPADWDIGAFEYGPGAPFSVPSTAGGKLSRRGSKFRMR